MCLAGSIFADLQQSIHYRKWSAYSRSKLANLLFSRELDRRSRARGLPLVSVAAHPGYAATNLQTVGPSMTGNLSAKRRRGARDPSPRSECREGRTADPVHGDRPPCPRWRLLRPAPGHARAPSSSLVVAGIARRNRWGGTLGGVRATDGRALWRARSSALTKPPCARQPCARQPCARRPCARQPCARRPCARRPCARRPCARRPCARQPCARPPRVQRSETAKKSLDSAVGPR